MNLIVLDTETSDLDPEKGAKMLEIAWIELAHTGGQWEQVGSYETYIECSPNIIINPKAQATHHITRDLLTQEKGARNRYETILHLQKFLKEDTYMVAHNAMFDRAFVPEVKHPWICTHRCAKHLYPGAPSYSNQVLRYWLDLKPDLPVNKFPHQALYDASVTSCLLLKMLEKATPIQLLNLSQQPVRLKSLTFGKHRGQNLTDVPRDYLVWLRRQSNLEPDLIYTLDYLLHQHP
jgi:exodeoxyribonuclease X